MLSPVISTQSYFVEDEKDREMKLGRGTRDHQVEVSLRKDGRGIIIALLMNGKLMKQACNLTDGSGVDLITKIGY